MKHARMGLIAAASFMALGVAQATTQTLALDDRIQVQTPWAAAQISDLAGTSKLTFSNPLIGALNTTRVTFAEVAPAELTLPYRPGTTLYQNNGATYATQPVSALTADFGPDSLKISEVQTAGGAKYMTVKNGATAGVGDLTISNLRVVIGDRQGFGGTIYADLSSTTAGFTNRTGYALWTFDQLLGSTTHAYPPLLGGSERLDMAHSLHGLFLVNSAEGRGLFQQALNLNNVGRGAFGVIENRGHVTNIDPRTGKVAGWGSITSNMSVVVTVPEPSTCALMLAGVLGVGMVARRRAPR
jgi:hypothetical protein